MLFHILDLLEYNLRSKGKYRLTCNIISEVETFWECL